MLDGAAAQYGTDAISGVVNLILKKRSSGGVASVTGGNYYNVAVATTPRATSYDYVRQYRHAAVRQGLRVNLTFDRQYSNFVQLGGADSRLLDINGNPAVEGEIGVGATATNNTFIANGSGVLPCTAGVCIPFANRQAVTDSPRSNTIDGNSSPEIQSRPWRPSMRAMTSATIFRCSYSLRHLGPSLWQGHGKCSPAHTGRRHAGLQPALQPDQSAGLSDRFQLGQRTDRGLL